MILPFLLSSSTSLEEIKALFLAAALVAALRGFLATALVAALRGGILEMKWV